MVDFINEYNIKIYNNIFDDENNNNYSGSNEENEYNHNNDFNYDSFNKNNLISYSESICDKLFERDSDNHFYFNGEQDISSEKYDNLDGLDREGLFENASTGPFTEKSKLIHDGKEKKENQKEQFKPNDINNIYIKKKIPENKKEEKKEEVKLITKKTLNIERRNDNKEYEKTKHTKSSEDNIMRKIKTRIFGDIFESLNNSIKNNSGEFLPLTPKINVNLKRDLNLKLLDRTIADIFANSDLNKRYNETKKDNNKNLIEKIFKENIETETIKISKMTFRDFLKEIREKNIEDFLNKIKTKEIKNEKKEKKENEEIFEGNIDEDSDNEKYISKLRRLLFEFENWFFAKKGRNNKRD